MFPDISMWDEVNAVYSSFFGSHYPARSIVPTKPLHYGFLIEDVGAKGLTMQERTVGICASGGNGCLLEDPDVRIDTVFDEHAIINHKGFRDRVRPGDKVRIVPAHICPVVNLYDKAYFCSGETVLEEVPILCRGKMQ